MDKSFTTLDRQTHFVIYKIDRQTQLILLLTEVSLTRWKWLVPKIQNSKESPTELNVSLFVRLEMMAQHLLLDSGLQEKFLLLHDLSQNGGRDHTMIASLIILNVVEN